MITEHLPIQIIHLLLTLCNGLILENMYVCTPREEQKKNVFLENMIVYDHVVFISREFGVCIWR